MKKRMVLADLDSEYLNHIAGYFMEHAPQLEQNLFTKSEKLRTYLERGEAADILVISEDMLDAVHSNLGEKRQNSAFINHGAERRICSCKKISENTKSVE